MSFDMVIFDNTKVPRDKDAFMKWYLKQVKWEDNLDYNDYHNLTNQKMRGFFEELIKLYPPMNGLLALSDEELNENPELEDKMADYSISKTMIYAALAWSEAEKGEQIFYHLTKKYGVGFFNCSSSDGKVFYND